MKKITILLLSIILYSFSLVTYAQQNDRIRAAYMIAFGRDANQGELTYWTSQGNLSVAQIVSRHKDYLSRDYGTQKTSIDRAYQDALGRYATQGEIDYWRKGNDTYSTLVQNHVSWLASNPAEYEKVIRRSYKFIFNREPSRGEINYWKGQGTYSYIILVGWHQDYKRRSQTGQTSDGKLNFSNASSVVSVNISTTVGNEIKSSGIVAGGAGNIISGGAGNIVAGGAGNVIAAGAGNVIAAGGLN